MDEATATPSAGPSPAGQDHPHGGCHDQTLGAPEHAHDHCADDGHCISCQVAPGYLENKAGHLKRIRRIQGQLRGLERMVENDEYCIDVLTQISAATGALQSLALSLLDDHLSHCVVAAARQGGEEAEIKLAEANDAIARLVRR